MLNGNSGKTSRKKWKKWQIILLMLQNTQQVKSKNLMRTQRTLSNLWALLKLKAFSISWKISEKKHSKPLLEKTSQDRLYKQSSQLIWKTSLNLSKTSISAAFWTPSTVNFPMFWMTFNWQLTWPLILGMWTKLSLKLFLIWTSFLQRTKEASTAHLLPSTEIFSIKNAARHLKEKNNENWHDQG